MPYPVLVFRPDCPPAPILFDSIDGGAQGVVEGLMKPFELTLRFGEPERGSLVLTSATTGLSLPVFDHGMNVLFLYHPMPLFGVCLVLLRGDGPPTFAHIKPDPKEGCVQMMDLAHIVMFDYRLHRSPTTRTISSLEELDGDERTALGALRFAA